MLFTWEGVAVLIAVATAIVGLHFKIERRLARLEARLEVLCALLTVKRISENEPR